VHIDRVRVQLVVETRRLVVLSAAGLTGAHAVLLLQTSKLLLQVGVVEMVSAVGGRAGAAATTELGQVFGRANV
jgi:hypothetical protein